MKHTRITGRRLTAAAVTAVLAATGGTLTAVPAVAAPAVPATATDTDTATGTQDGSVRFPLNAEVVSAGTTGFLSKTNATTPEYRWTRYADGTSTVLPGADVVAGGASDIVVTADEEEEAGAVRVLKVHDMSAPSAAPVEVDLDALGAKYYFVGAIGSTLYVVAENEAGLWDHHLVTVDGGSVTDRPVTGLPEEQCLADVNAYAAGTVVFDCMPPMGPAVTKAVVDLGSAAVVSTHVIADASWWFDTAVSATHVAWDQQDATGQWFTVARRGSTETRRVDVGVMYSEDTLHLIGDWVITGQPRRIESGGQPYQGQDPRPPRPYVARSADTGETIQLLTHVSSAVPAPDGSLLVRGGTLDKGEGLYRVALGEGGKPVVTLVASTGQATAVTLLGKTVPSVITGDRLATGIDFSWNLSRGDVYAWVTLKHVRTGQQEEWPLVKGGGSWAPRTVGLKWDGKELSSSSYDPTGPALNGEYTWELLAKPDEGIGPTLTATGRFTVTRPVAAHDYNDNGTPDLFVREPDGDLLRFGTQRSPAGDRVVNGGADRVGPGWGIYDRVESVGNLAGTSVADVIGRDRSGVLWLHQGTGLGAKPLAPRTRIGGGWQTYDKLAGGSDLTGDGRADLVAADKLGDLYLYKGTGKVTEPFSVRTKIGRGWGIYNELTATGNIGGGPAGDLVARDRAGVLWLHLGKGDGTFASRIRIGGGWGAFTGITAVGDANGDGRADLIASNGAETFYAGTGSWSAPLKPGVSVSLIPDVYYNAAF